MPDKTVAAIPRQLIASMEALGLVMSFVAREPPFSEYRAGTLLQSLKYQLSTRNHVCLLQGETVVAYCGWLPITIEQGENWVKGQGSLSPVESKAATAYALTIVSVASNEFLLPAIRACRQIHPDRRAFFKRDTQSGESRKGSVHSK